jgi:hypothetical protein
LTMFESSSNFKKIFRSGLLVKDIEHMQSFLKKENHLKTHIVTLATELALTEALDLKNELDQNLQDTDAHTELIINDSFKKFFEINRIEQKDLPNFLLQKLKLEEGIVETHLSLPHIDRDNTADIVRELSSLVDGLK